MNIRITLLLSVVFTFQCGAHRTESTQHPSQAKQPDVEEEKKPCDFSEYKPLKLMGTLGSPSLSMPRPEYPPEAKERKIEGPITVKVLINVRSGLVEQVCAINGDRALGRAAEAAALKAKLSPYNDYVRGRYSYAEGIVKYSFVAQ